MVSQGCDDLWYNREYDDMPDQNTKKSLGAESDMTSGGVAAVDRALKIVKFITHAENPVTLAALSEGTGFYKSTCLRLLASLEAADLVCRREDHTYHLSYFAYDLGRAYEKSLRIADVLLPLMQHMVDEGCESASFHLLRDERTPPLPVAGRQSSLDAGSCSRGVYLPDGQRGTGEGHP